jgi:DNA polymerase-1
MNKEFSKNSSKKLVIIDSYALLHRAWHAIPPLETKNGLLVNAVYGFSALVLNIIKQSQPDYIMAAFDLAGPTFRHTEYDNYKAQRVKQADEFYNQIPLAREVLDALEIPILSQEGFEADDILGSVATQAYKQYPNLDIFIVTGDLDTLQLVNDRIKVLTLKKGFNDIITYDIEAVKERYDLAPRQIIDLKAIMGDASDNIKGVKGIGQKGASDLIREFGDLENLYKNIASPKIKDRTRDLLLADQENAIHSKHLVTIVTDLKLDWSLEAMAFGDFDKNKVLEIFQKFEFNSLLNKIPTTTNSTESATPVASPLIEKKVETKKDYQLINNEKSFDKFILLLKKQKLFAFDTETEGLDTINDAILGCSFAWKKDQGFYINLTDKNFKENALEKLKPILEDEDIKKTGHNLKFDYKVLRALDITLNGICFDTLIAAYLVNPNRGLKLEELAFSYLGYQKSKLSDLIPEDETSRKARSDKHIEVKDIPLDKLAWYAAEDADIALALYHKLLPESKETKNFDLLTKMELPLLPVLAEMEINGICLDVKFLKEMEKTFTSEIKKVQNKIFKLAGTEFNVSSPLQLKEILFDKLEIKTQGIKKTKTGLSTAASELEKMKTSHPIIEFIIEYRELTKLQSTYIKALPELLNKTTKRIHTSFNQTIAATGRLSSSDPNLQNIPMRTDLGRKIRQAFVAAENYVLLSADYSQIELRLAAALSKDPKMIESFKKGEDIHSRTAAEIHKIPLAEVDKEIRRTAKEVNFGILYGLGSLGLAQRTGMNRNEAKKFIERYFDIYKKIKTYLDNTKKFAAQHGYVQTLFGRRRQLPDIYSSMPQLKAAAERMAINMPIQGTAADLLKLAMIKLHAGLPKISKNSKMLLQVHDELVLEVPKAELKKVAKFVKETMENIYTLSVPLAVDLEIGKNWYEQEKLEI